MSLPALQLSLAVGPVVAIPAPREVVDAFVEGEIRAGSGEEGGFSLTFELSSKSPLHTLFLLAGGSIPPILRVVLSVSLGGTTEVLADGVVTHHQVSAGQDGKAQLTIMGSDLGRLMDLQSLSGLPFPAMPVMARVLLLLAKYAPLGVIPLVIPPVLEEIPIPITKIPAQKGTDLAYIRELAKDAGYIFHLEPGPVAGASTAYWGPEIKVGPIQPALTVDLDLARNVERINFAIQTDGRVQPVVMIHNELTKVPIPLPVPDVSLLNPPLGLVPPWPSEIRAVDGSAKRSVPAAILKGLGEAASSSECATADGTLDVRRYGRILKPRRLVGVRGAGPAWNGLWYVRRVKHKLSRQGLTQEFSLARNGLLSTVPKVPT